MLSHRQLDGGSDIVTAQLIAVLASLLKRGWLESAKEERNAFFAELENNVATSERQAAARRAWARILVVRCHRGPIPPMHTTPMNLSRLENNL